jgi:hypothetical protein
LLHAPGGRASELRDLPAKITQLLKVTVNGIGSYERSMVFTAIMSGDRCEHLARRVAAYRFTVVMGDERVTVIGDRVGGLPSIARCGSERGA